MIHEVVVLSVLAPSVFSVVQLLSLVKVPKPTTNCMPSDMIFVYLMHVKHHCILLVLLNH